MTATLSKDYFKFRQKNSVTYLVCEPMEKAGFINAFSTRGGGVSALPENALNLSYREDKKEDVDANRKRFLASIGQENKTVVTGNQKHTDQRLFVESLSALEGVEPECDALVTALPNVLIGIQSADCLPVLVGDPKSGFMAAIHAGWRGTMALITEKTITEELKTRGVDPSRCVAALGPSACAECYEVGADVVETFKTQWPDWEAVVKSPKANGKANLDVPQANLQQLLNAGIPREKIYLSPHCTIHQNELFFSYRVEAKGGAVMVGRQLAVMGRS